MMQARRNRRMTRLGLTALLVLVTAALLAGCKKKKKAAAPVPSTPVQFTSTPGAVSENAPLTCDGFLVADSAKARSALAHLADGAAGKAPAGSPDLSCLLAGALAGKKTAEVIDATKAHALVEHGDFLPWNIEEAQSKPPHWSTSVTGASECQRLSKDGAAAYFCKIAGVYRLIQVENLGPGLTAPTN